MKRLVTAIVICFAPLPLVAGEWIAAPSTYTHDPRTAERVNQYSPIGPVYAFPDPHVQSGYRHVQSVIRAGGSADYLHVVEEWGARPVRPYGEWQFPYRPYSVPYDMWGPPVYLGYPYQPYPYPYDFPVPYNPYQGQGARGEGRGTRDEGRGRGRGYGDERGRGRGFPKG